MKIILVLLSTLALSACVVEPVGPRHHHYGYERPMSYGPSYYGRPYYAPPNYYRGW